MTWPANAFPNPGAIKISRFLIFVAMLLAFSAWGGSSVPLVWSPSGDPNVAGYKIYYGVASQSYTSSVDVGNVTSASVSVPSSGVTYYFAATTYDTTGAESDFSNEASYSVAPNNQTYQPPTLAGLNNISISQNAGLQTANLSGISLGSGTALTITASSSNPALIPNPTVNYSSPNATGTLTFIPVSNQAGTATITVTANNGQPKNNVVTRTFIVSVAAPVYSPPTLAGLNNISISQGAGLQTANLSGIGLGSGSTVAITASSSNPALISNPTVNYSSPNATGTLTFTPTSNQSGTAVITVTANNGQPQNNLVTRTFTVNVAAPVYSPPTLAGLNNISISQGAGLQTANLSGIGLGSGSALTITASSSNPALIPNPTVNYSSPNATGTLAFTSASNQSGTATITVTANNGQPQNNLVTRTFTVNVATAYAAPTLALLNNISINQNAGSQAANLSGVSAGSGSALTFTISSSNPALIPKPTVNYISPNSTGTLMFTPAVNQSGVSVITVTANNGQTKSNLITRTFTVSVAAVYAAPTLSPVNNLLINENAGLQTINLSGIGLGTGAGLTFTATSSNPALIANPAINYTSPSTTGTLTFTPVKNMFGTTTITVTGNNGLSQNNLITRTFTVTVAPVNQPPTLNTINNLSLTINAAAQKVSLSGISSGAANESQVLSITAVSSDPTVVSDPTVTYVTPSAIGTLTVTPVANSTGTAIITVTVNDGGASNNIITRTFNVTVADKAVAAAAASKPVVLNKLENRIVLVGKPVSFKISAKGKGPLQYQWKHNGTNVLGATKSALTIKSLTLEQAGTYYVTVANSMGATNSTAASVIIAPTSAATLTPSASANGQFSFKVEGVTDYKYTVQASTNLINWTTVATGTAPFTFTDNNSSQFGKRFYRTVSQ